MNVDTEQLITTKQAARMFGVTEQGIFYWRDTDPTFPTIELKAPGERAAIRFHYPDLEAWAQCRGKQIFYSLPTLKGI